MPVRVNGTCVNVAYSSSASSGHTNTSRCCAAPVAALPSASPEQDRGQVHPGLVALEPLTHHRAVHT
jgi:hypothetical protein